MLARDVIQGSRRTERVGRSRHRRAGSVAGMVWTEAGVGGQLEWL